jgi:drug/metabolite transporter (DMT)-like permease
VPDQRRSLDATAVGVMLVLTAVWGFQQTAIKVAAPSIAPIVQVALRSTLSALLVGATMVATRQRWALRDGTLAAGALAGGLFALEFVLIAEGLRYTTASHMAVFLYTAPLFTALGLHWLEPSERLDAVQWAGMALAFGGVALALAGRSFSSAGPGVGLLGDAMGLAAGLAWGATTVVVRTTKLASAPATKTLAYQLVAAALACAAYAVLSGQAAGTTPTPLAVGSVIFQGVVVSFASYLTWFSLLRRYSASRLASFSLVTPVFGIFFGVMLLHEPVDGFFAIGAAFVLAGLLVLNLRRARQGETPAFEPEG